MRLLRLFSRVVPLVLALFLVPPYLLAAETFELTVEEDKVRGSPSTRSEVLGKLRRGEKLEIVGHQGNGSQSPGPSVPALRGQRLSGRSWALGVGISRVRNPRARADLTKGQAENLLTFAALARSVASHLRSEPEAPDVPRTPLLGYRGDGQVLSPLPPPSEVEERCPARAPPRSPGHLPG